MTTDEINNAYFNWLYDLVCAERFSSKISFRKLLLRLHNTEFTYMIPNDCNRAEDGIALRWRFSNAYPDEFKRRIWDTLTGPCSVLEMMIALAIRCEENIMDDPMYGNRTSQWFWNMMGSLGLGGIQDDRFDRVMVDTIVHRFLIREYAPDGKGGLFRVKHCDFDLRTVEIWRQLLQYVNSIS
jgi:hypothetical protein